LRPLTLIVVLVCLTSAVAAHDGVKNAAVQARMHAMTNIGDALKVLVPMAKGKAPFDLSAAQAALQSIADHASQTPGLFEANETDPKSEALPEIWTSFADFTAKAEAMEQVAARGAELVDTREALGETVRELSGTCLSCHKLYRE